MDVSRIYRLLQLVTLLQTDRYYSSRQLAALCGVSRRTVFRDLKALGAARIPVVSDVHRGGYHISETFFLPPAALTIDESLALVVLARELGNRKGIPFQQAAVQAASKIESALPDPLRREIAQRARVVHLEPPPLADHTGRHALYTQLLDALCQGRVVRLYYDSLFEGRVIRAKVKPYRLLFANHAWYLIGHSCMHRSERLFNLVRVKEIELTDERFTIPRRFTLDRFLGNAWRLIRGEKRYRVILRFSPKVARNVAEVRWHKTQRIRWLPDGSLEFRVEVDGMDEIAWWILGYGDQVYVLEPACLRDRIREAARNIVEQYSAAPTPGALVSS